MNAYEIINAIGRLNKINNKLDISKEDIEEFERISEGIKATEEQGHPTEDNPFSQAFAVLLEKELNEANEVIAKIRDKLATENSENEEAQSATFETNINDLFNSALDSYVIQDEEITDVDDRNFEGSPTHTKVEPLEGHLKGGRGGSSGISTKELNASMEKVNEYIDHYNKMNSLGLINNSIKESLDEINSYMNIADIKISINASKDSSELASHPNVISDTKIMMKHIDTLAKHGKMLSGDPDFGQEIIDSVKSTLEGAKSSQLQQLSQPSKSNAEVNMPLETKTNGIETTPVDIKEHFTKKVEKLIAQEPRILNDRKQDPVGYQDFLKIMLTLRDEIKASSLKPENKEIKSDLEAQAKRIDKSILRQANLSQKVSIKTQRLGEKKSEKIQEKIASKNEESHNEGTQPPRMRK